jgi:hypothetical protein
VKEIDVDDAPVTEDNDEGLTFRLGPPVVQATPARDVPVPSVVPTASAVPEAAPEGPAEVTPVVPSDPEDGAPRKEPMKVLKLRVPAPMHAQVIALMESFGCVNESQMYRQVLYVGLKHTRRSR